MMKQQLAASLVINGAKVSDTFAPVRIATLDARLMTHDNSPTGLSQLDKRLASGHLLLWLSKRIGEFIKVVKKVWTKWKAKNQRKTMRGNKILQKFVVLAVMPLFVFSFLNLPHQAEAAFVPGTVTPEPVPLVPGTITPDYQIPLDAIRVEKSSKESSTKVLLDPRNLDRIYLLSDTSAGKTLTLKYIYDDYLYTITLLVSMVPQGEEPVFSQYYRYSQGPRDSLESILEEGWVKDNTLSSAYLYDYAQGKFVVRAFDRTGKLLRIEFTDGSKRVLVYSREEKLLTIQDVDGAGQISFYDQLTNSKSLELPLGYFDRSNLLFVLPDRGKEKLFTPTGHSRVGGNLSDPRFLEDDNPDQSHYFLLWLEAAHPLRAGPAGGFLL
jgi:hypothetical protein